VYSLGVILYQLLVGVLPFEGKTLQDAGLEEILRVIREQQPPRPSSRIRSMGPASAASAEKRKEEPRSLVRHLQGELDWITMKALGKDRTRRYGSPAELGADIENYLRNEPVLAHPPGAGYRASKFVKRHRFGAVAAASAVVLLIGFAAAMTVQARRIAIERDRANRQAETARRVADFMKGMFKVSDPSEARGNGITVREILDKASKEIDTGLAQDPETQAQLMGVMGEVYESLGLQPRAQPLLEHALEIQRQVHGPRNRETLKAADDLVWLLFEEGHYAEAETLGRETLDIRRQVLGPEHPDTLTSMRHLGSTLQQESRCAEAEKMLRELLDIERRVFGPEHPETLRTTTNLGATLIVEGRSSEAEKMERELLDTERRVLGPVHPDTLGTINNLAETLQDEGRSVESEKMQRELLEVKRRVLGPEHPETLRTINNLAHTLAKEGRYAEAGKMQHDVLDIQRRVLGPEHPDTAISVYNLGCLAAHQGRRNEAFSLLRQAVDHGLPTYLDLGIDKDSDLQSLRGDACGVGLSSVPSLSTQRMVDA
jgi:non-specific serine/threonine protein kinase/serine/threonine-protein kinase